ncbi:hypothetical protein MCUN1_003150 [Malassezia cuniculi]|uniref:Metal resistance protein YCF1 n=1 Tax=Malassezia cuniculi TaxID=948313 RepID=A0AAF0EWZ8_9BASI|nr:hypothetical protein MCUN1_003150 [Malassezia cuniculi]
MPVWLADAPHVAYNVHGYIATAVSACRVCDDIEGWGPASPLRLYDLTPCFQAVMLWFVPAVLFLLMACFSVRELRTMPVVERDYESNSRLREKDGVNFAIALLALVELAALAIIHVDEATPLTSSIQLAIQAFMVATYVVCGALQHMNHRRARRGSDAAQLFWLMHLFSVPIRLRTMLSSTSPGLLTMVVILVPFVMRGVLAAIAFVLESADIEVEGAIALGQEDEEDGQVVPTETDAALAVAPESPFDTANLISRLSFSWMQPLMSLGSVKFLTEADMWALPHGDDAESLGNRFQHVWHEYASNPIKCASCAMRFWFTLFRAYGRPFMVAAAYKMVQDALAFTTPQVLRMLLAFVQEWQDPNTTRTMTSLEGYALSVLLFIVALVQVSCLHQYFQLVAVTGMHARSGVISAIFRKSLLLTSEERSKRAAGDVVNLMSVDANRLPDFLMYAHILWSAVFQICLAFISLYRLLGWSAFVGVAIMFVSLPLNMYLAQYMRNLSAKQMKIKDRRSQLMNEIILNIKSIKLFSWESAFRERVSAVRNDEELPILRMIGYASSLFNFFWSAIPFLVSLGTFITFAIVSDTPLTADIAFPALALYQLLNFPLTMLAGIVSMLLQTQVSAERLGDFLDADELATDAVSRGTVDEAPVVDGKRQLVRLDKASFSWSDSQSPTLSELDLTVHEGELVAVLGRVGDGKSSLLSAIMGDMNRTAGTLNVNGRTALFSQGGWCMGSSVRDNILFGRVYDEEHYKKCIFACALQHDLEILPDGDQTEIGERGVSLSGGQRARVALARACYAAADIYLLDDPLAAVDAHVGAHIWTHVLGPSGMLASRTRILSLNAVSYLAQCDTIITLRNGHLIEERGTFDELMARRGDVYNLIQGLGRTVDEAPKTDKSYKPQKIRRPRELERDELRADQLRQLRDSTKPSEKQQQGQVKWQVYEKYAESASIWGVSLYIAMQFVTLFVSISKDVVLKQWSAANTNPNGRSMESISRLYLTLYSLAGFGEAIGFCIMPLILFTWLVIASSRRIHDTLFNNVIHYPLQWFESVPSGRLLNLFSRDVSVMDEVLPRVIHAMIRSSAAVVGVLGVIAYSVPLFLIALVPLIYAYRAVMRYYLATSRELRRLDATSKAPIFTWFQESLAGLSSIRAYGQVQSFTDAFETRIDRNQMCYFPSVTVNRWLAFRVELIAGLVVLGSSMMAVYIATTSDRMSSGLLGLLLSQVLNTTQRLNWAVRSASEVEQNIVSIERIMSYSDLPQEAAYDVAATDPGSSWPREGRIEFQGYSARYRDDLDLVLRDLSFTIQPGERIGVVGRTGAGKSSLTLALFRILEAASGRILVDGVDTSTLGLHQLRSSIAIIPQDAQLWLGTLRQNIDPLNEHDDELLIKVLRQSNLGALVDSRADVLDMNVAEGGANFSAGQRQLICIARALVRSARILVLDEATSSIDLETDDSIQRIVRSEFKGTTITIAHRLNTILDSTRVLVLGDGKVLEFDTPTNLLKRDDSVFTSMARDAGLVSAIQAARK